ncbi:MAG: PilC/PilY family type IV pilus protein [Sedimenticola sp.]|nr:PilC/PilY family type IV pilus protein [Sedimenticola sp.]
MDMNRLNHKRLGLTLLVGVYTFLSASSAIAAAPNISQDPLTLSTSADPNILINLSVETPMGGAAYNDQPDGGSCAGRDTEGGGTVGFCYDRAKDYIGYFNPNRCYDYNSGGGYFVPAVVTNSFHECSGKYSGNFMNWATMTAMDAFLYTMTGGNRVTDTMSLTVVERAKKHNQSSHNWFPIKFIGTSRNVSPSTVTPYSGSAIFILNDEWTVKFGTTRGGAELDTLNVKVKVCEPGKLEANCVEYDNAGTPYYKPEGLIQKNAANKRFAVSSYLAANNKTKDGGVLRALMKYVGPDMPLTTGFGSRITNPAKEFGTDGLLVLDPDSQSGSGGVTDSGVINYINKFSRAHGYKSYDPVSELFYESLRYFRGQTISAKGPTTNYASTSNGERGGFPDYRTWDDPIQYSCQKNFIIGINDANPWRDKKLPGTHFSAPSIYGHTIADSDYGGNTNDDSWFDVTTYTNKVGDLEGLNGTTQCIGCVSGDCASGTANLTSSNKSLDKLGQVFGTCSYAPKENSYYVAGLAYQANTQDMRSESDMPGKQTVTTFMIDTQEYNANPLTGQMNMLWLAGKYGGFNDLDDDGVPDAANPSATPPTPNEWDADGDGEPDNYVLATNPEKMVTALNNTFSDIEKRDSSSSAVVANSVRLQAGTKIFQARFNSGEWSGELLAYPVNTDGSVGAAEWNAQTVLDAQNWSSARNIFTYDPTANSGAGEGRPFVWSSLNSAQQALLNLNPDASPAASDSKGQDRLEFLRGNQSKEIGNTGGTFRKRTSILGDLINSAPVYVAEPNFLYNDEANCASNTPTTCYSAFKSTHASRMPIIYVGGNDGMLHGFIPEESSASAGDEGTEVVAYVPNFLMSGLNQLTSPDYSHRYFVDGNPTVADVFIDADASGSDEWNTVLIGGARGGGQGYFALNITDPTNFATVKSASQDVTNAQKLALWEFTDADDVDLGYTYSQPAIAKMANGEWAAVFGNGYGSTVSDGNVGDGDAVLYIAFLEGGLDGTWTVGSDYIKIDTGEGSTSEPNGMSTPAPVDTDGDGLVDAIYAGDLYGNMWKVDVSSTNTNLWDNSSKRYKLFSAVDDASPTNKQPITTRPDVGAHPLGGVMVYFGTGKYFETGDNNPSNYGEQTFYGIRDQGSAVSGRSDLQEQTVIQEAIATGGVFRVTSNIPVDWTTKDGWFMDLTDTGEIVVVNPKLNNGLIVFVTQVPSSDPCDSGGYSWIMEMDAVTGGWPSSTNLDVDGDGDVDAADVLASVSVDADGDGDASNDGSPRPTGQKSTEGILTEPTILPAGTKEYKYSSGSQGGIEVVVEASGLTKGRQSWQQIR